MWMSSRYEFDRRRRSISTSKLITLLTILGAVILFSVVIAVMHKESPLPKSIQKQVGFMVFYPGDSWQVNANAITYDTSAKTLTMTAIANQNRLTITEQETPAQFNDIPQYYPALLDKLQQYDSFGTVNGTVYLTHPKELNGGTEAVLNHNGTLMFVFPNKAMNSQGWHQFFNSLHAIPSSV
jgi:hypothetical protein